MTTRKPSKRILITGASRGIGREAARQLAKQGHIVVLAARDETALEGLAREILDAGGNAEVLAMDVTDDTSVRLAVDTLLEGGVCDVVVNNAGSCEQSEFLLQSSERQRAEMEINYWGPLRVTRAVLPALIRRGEGQIVNVSSLLGGIAAPTTANYGASKAALESWSFALRAEVARFGVNVCVFVAPHTQTEMGKAVQFDGIVSLPVEYTAKALCTTIELAPRKYAGSPVYRILLWLGRLFPAFMEARVGAGTRRLWAKDPLNQSVPQRVHQGATTTR